MPNSGSIWKAFTPPLGMDPSDARFPVDPYLVWAEATGYVGYPPNDDPAEPTVPVLLEFVSALGGIPPPVLPEALEEGLGPARTWAPKSCNHTALVPRSLLLELVRLQQQDVLVRFQLGAARGKPVQVASNIHSTARADSPINTLGVVDDGCCIAHAAFRMASPTPSRFAFIWDQNPSGPFKRRWQKYEVNGNTSVVGYGAELQNGDINLLLKSHPELGEDGERALYNEIERPQWGNPDRIHGACVLHVLAGPATYLQPAPPPSSGATRLPIIFVQLPDQTVNDTSGGSIGFYVLDAVRYIIQRTRDLNRSKSGKEQPWATTINVSLGSLGGPHDGSTIVERALDEIVQVYTDPDGTQRVSIVMAAGNAAERQVHGVRAIKPKGTGDFHVMVPPANDRESFVELWPQLSNPADADHLLVSVSAPDGAVLTGAKVGDIHVLRDGHNRVVASLVFPRAVAQGGQGPMILLAIRPTENAEHPDEVAPYGAWTVKVTANTQTPVTVHGWVERNDTVIKRRNRQRTVFIDSVAPGDKGGWLSDASTLSSLANGEETYCVGGYEINRQRVTDYASRGPVLGSKQAYPALHGASDASASLPGIGGPGFFSGTRARLSGTSAGAPRVARWIAEGKDFRQVIGLDPGHSPAAHAVPVGVAYIAEVKDTP